MGLIDFDAPVGEFKTMLSIGADEKTAVTIPPLDVSDLQVVGIVEFCTCGAERDKQSGFSEVRDKTSPYFGMWVHSQCGKPTKLYLEAP